jgi:hypothetical protein
MNTVIVGFINNTRYWLYKTLRGEYRKIKFSRRDEVQFALCYCNLEYRYPSTMKKGSRRGSYVIDSYYEGDVSHEQ